MPAKKYSQALLAEVEMFCRLGNSFADAAQKFNMSEASIRSLAKRGGWRQSDIKRDRETMLARVARVATETWAEKSEAHRLKMFGMASEALAKAKLKAPQNWRDVETVDRIARRAAGLDDDGGKGTIVQLALIGGPEAAEPAAFVQEVPSRELPERE